MSHTIKLWERVFEYRLRKMTTVSKNQFGLCLRGPIFICIYKGIFIFSENIYIYKSIHKKN
jgi:hypothetical protein